MRELVELPKKDKLPNMLSLAQNPSNIGIEKLHIKEVKKQLLWALVGPKVMLMYKP